MLESKNKWHYLWVLKILWFNSLYLIDDVIFLDICLGNSLLFEGTKPLPELMLHYHQKGHEEYIYE